MKNTFSSLKYILPVGMILVSLLMTGCKKEMVSLTFLAEAEAPAEDGAKTYLSNESMVFWEEGDQIDAQGEKDDSKRVLEFKGGESNPTALFEVSQDAKFTGGSSVFYALFPHNDGNTLGNGNMQVVFPADQGYVDDNTFGRAACPMVAYGGDRDNDEVVRMTFHNLCGLVRIQLRNTSDIKTLKSITFTSQDESKPLSGLFEVHNYDSYSPYVTATPGSSSVTTINNINQTISTTPLTFYLVLPAGSGTTNYSLTMQVNAEYGNTPYYFKKSFTVPIRRNGITKMQSLAIYSWSQSADLSGDATIGITGNGTASRPFLIYTADELVMVRDAYRNSSSINGYPVSNSGLCFRLMRSDIVLNDENWTSGIPSFSGTFIFGGNQTSSHGITNNSSSPIFESILSSGSVTNLAVKGNSSWSMEESVHYSPLCRTNAGRIINCRVVDASYVISYSGSDALGLAGICVENSGTISGCGCRATLVAPHVAGICYHNTSNGNIKGCYVSSPMTVYNSTSQAVRAAGVCYRNEGTIQDCYFAANIHAPRATEWGGLAYLNTGTVKHSYVDASGIIQSTTSVGGIVHTMTGGMVDNCWNDADLMNVQNTTAYTSGGLGGIVFSLQGGEIRNCIRYRPAGSFTCTGGGIVGGFVARMTGGFIRNSAFYGDLTQSTSSKGAFVGSFTGGTIENAYAYQSLGTTLAFYYQTANSGTTFVDCFGQTVKTGVTIPSSYADLLSSLNSHGWTENSGSYKSWQAYDTENSAPPILVQ